MILTIKSIEFFLTLTNDNLKNIIVRKNAPNNSSPSPFEDDQSFLRRIADIITINNSLLDDSCAVVQRYCPDFVIPSSTCLNRSNESKMNLLDVFIMSAISLITSAQSYIWDQQRSVSWNNVDFAYNEAYSCTCIILSILKLICLDCNIANEVFDLENCDELQGSSEFQIISLIIKDCDYGILMGSPLLSSVLNELIDLIKSCDLYKYHRKRKIEEIGKISHNRKNIIVRSGIRSFISKIFREHLGGSHSVRRPIRRVASLDMLSFFNSYMIPMEPVIITGMLDDWPAISDKSRNWSNLDYLIQYYGDRVVPVETGSHYLASDSSQCLISLSQFIDQYILKVDESTSNASTKSKSGIGYLAQHKLFDQIPELRLDIATPDYCALSHPNDYERENSNNGASSGGESNEDDDVHTNAWLGPDNSVSPLHHDPYFNLLAQVVGNKYVRLYSREESSKLYPMTGRSYNNSQIDFTSLEDVSIDYPNYQGAAYSDAVLEPGDMLFIPRWCWHFITSLNSDEKELYNKVNSDIELVSKSSTKKEPEQFIDKKANLKEGENPSFSFSVNFWWGRRIEKKDEIQ